MKLFAQVNCVTEIPLRSSCDRTDPYNEVDVDVLFTSPDGKVLHVPAFWSGDNQWKVRFAAGALGEHRFETRVSPSGDAGLESASGVVVVLPYTGSNPLLRHGRLQRGTASRHFSHADGTPFFWIGDTWWMGLTTRLGWPGQFKELAADRAGKGFNVVQIVAGPYPDMDAWDPRGRNEAGFPFEEDFARVNPAYFDHADLKLAGLVDAGLMPCIVGMWGYYLPLIGVEKIKRYWRHLIARYGAYPVTLCVCGECMMPHYLSKTRPGDALLQKEGWSEVMSYVRNIDPFRNLITVHPTHYGRDQVTDPALMDFEMLQTGHSDIESVAPSIDSVRQAVEREPAMPVIDAEVNYEGILGRCWQNIQRLCFYHTVLNGAAGFTYGANGVWQFSAVDQPYGPSPHGRCWGNTPWTEAAQLPGSRQVGLAGRFMQRFPWQDLEPHPEWLGASQGSPDPYQPIAAGIPGRLRIVYIPMCWDPPTIQAIEAGVVYRAFYFDPCTGAETPLGEVVPDASGSWTPPLPPEVHDWLLVFDSCARTTGMPECEETSGTLTVPRCPVCR